MAKKKKRKGTGLFSSEFFMAAGLFTVAGALLAGFGTLYLRATQKEKLDDISLCPAGGPVAQLAILIDRTDPASSAELNIARREINDAIQNAETGTRITVGVVSPKEVDVENSFISVCKPPSGEQADQLIQNVKQVESTYQERFVRPLDSLLSSLLVSSVEDSSPILEDLDLLLSRISDFNATVQSKKLIVVSNLTQHSPEMSFYNGDDWSSFATSNQVSLTNQSLAGFEVKIVSIAIDPEIRAVVEDFWVRFFDAKGVDGLSI